MVLPKSSKTILNEFCHSQRLPVPLYESERINRLWQSRVIVSNMIISGDESVKKSDSEKSSALKAILTFRNLGFNIPTCVEEDNSPANPPSQPPSQPPIQTSFHPFIPPLPNSNFSQRIPQRFHLERNRLFQEVKFENNYFNEEFLSHFELVVRNKHIEICNNPEYKSIDAPVIIYLDSQTDQITSNLLNNLTVRINIPAIYQREAFQASIILTMCMELGASSCSVISIPVRDVTHINLIT